MNEILRQADEIIMFHKCFNDKAMKSCQAIGYNGFKRLHRWNAKKFFKYHLGLENESFDKFRMEMQDINYPQFSYNPKDLLEHLAKWDSKLKDDIMALAKLNNEYREYTGNGNCYIEKALKRMTKNHEKTGRWYKRFMETKSAHDMHSLDDWLHEKIKTKEDREKGGK